MRWILLLIGIALVAGIYVFGRLQARADKPRGRLRRKTVPDIGGGRFDDFPDEELEKMGRIVAGEGAESPDDVMEIGRKTPAPAAVGSVFSLFVVAPTSVPFRAPVLLGALAAAKLEFGDMQIFHRLEVVNGREQVMFSAANIREPGTFDLSAMEDFTTEGLALFMQVPCAVDAGRAFDAMVESARILADSLDGQVCDTARNALTEQSIRHMREQVINSQLQQRVAQTAS